jgi:HAE1 family hydrophobic/amphiphilic exporter-1
MRLIEAFVRNPVKVSVGVLLVVLFGMIGMFRMPVQLTPEVQIPTVTIETRWPGASPQEVEREIVQEQEEQLKAVEGVTKMTSESFDSLARITLEFRVGTDLNEALVKVNARLQQVREYPPDADEPVINTANLSDRPIAWFILTERVPTAAEIAAFTQKHPELAEPLQTVARAHNPGLALIRLRKVVQEHSEARALLPPEVDVPRLRRFAEDVIEARFERVPGVANANVLGGREEEMQVVVDPQRLAARRLTITDIRAALEAQNRDTSGGDVWEGKRRYVVRTLGQFRSPEQVANVILARRDDAPIYLRDVADVRLGYKKPDGIVRRFGKQAIAINALRQAGANVLEVMEGLRQANQELNDRILRQRGLQLSQVYDETEYIHSSIGLVTDNIYLAAGLTFATLIVFLKSGRSTLIIALAIPISIVGTFLVLSLLGRSLNVISLAGLAFAVGMLVDNAIVVLENIFRRYQQGENSWTASVQGAHEVWGAIVNSTLTTLAVFLPVLFVEEEAGQLFRDIALAISASVGLSLLVAIVVIPTAAARVLEREFSRSPGRDAGESIGRSSASTLVFRALLAPVDRLGRAVVRLVQGANRWLQRGVLRRLALAGLVVGGSISIARLLVPHVEYLPAGNRNLVIGILLPPPGYNLEQLMAMGERIEAGLRPYFDVDPDSPEARELEYPVIGDFFYVARGRQLFMGLRAHDPLRGAELAPLVRHVASQVPGTIAIAKQTSLFEQGLTAGRTIDIEITGPDIGKLVQVGGEILGRVATVVPNAQAIPVPSLDLSAPELHVVPKWEQAADMGVTATDLGYAVDALVDGAYATDYFTGGDKIDLTIIGREQFVQRTQDLAALPVATPSGELVTLSAVADVALSSGPEQINHRERQRAITVQVSPPLDVALDDALHRIDGEIVEPLVSSPHWDEEYRIGLAGTADKLRATWRALRFNVLLAVLITYLLMAALFESWLYPLVIILSVPCGAVGGLAGLWLLNHFVLQSLDVVTMLGFVILVGTVVNNPILIVDHALQRMRLEGISSRVAVVEAVTTRIRPIFMTTLTTVLGLLPLVISPGAGSELYRGLGAVVLGGLTIATVLTLFLVPTVFTLMVDARASFLSAMRSFAWLIRAIRTARSTATRAGAPAVSEAQPQSPVKSRA